MIRTLTIAAGLAASASAASAALVGFEIREDAALNSTATGLIGQDARVLRLFAIYDGPGTPGPLSPGVIDPNEFTGIGNLNTGDVTMSLAQGTFYQDAFGADTVAGLNPLFIPLAPSVEWDSYLAVGGDVFAAGATLNTQTSTAPDFVWGPDSITGSWFNSAPGNDFADARADGAEFSVFAGQFTVVGAGVGSSNVTRINGTFDQSAIGTHELIRGTFTVNSVAGAQGPLTITLVPTPGALALFGLSGLAATRRRRNA